MAGGELGPRGRLGVSREAYDRPPTPAARCDVQPPEPVSAATRRTMQANKRRDTGPELQLRSALHGGGLRYRVDHPLPFDRRRRADIVFTRVGLFVFIDGCFWHGCPDHYVEPKTRVEFWRQKVRENRERDRDTDVRLRNEGFESVRIWEHEEVADAVARVTDAYERRRLRLRV